MEETKTNVPFIVFESELARLERTIKRFWVLCIIELAIIVGFVYYESQWHYVETTETITQGDGVNIVSGGDTNYGTDN